MPQLLNDAAQIQTIGLDAENPHAAHAIEWFENDVLVRLMKPPYGLCIARHQRGRRPLGKLHQRQFFRMIAQGLRAVEYLGPLARGLLEQMGGIKIL